MLAGRSTKWPFASKMRLCLTALLLAGCVVCLRADPVAVADPTDWKQVATVLRSQRDSISQSLEDQIAQLQLQIAQLQQQLAAAQAKIDALTPKPTPKK